MRAVRGTVVKSRPVSISRAANIISRFATAAVAGDIGATRELTAYLGRTARAIDELDQLHLHLRSRYLTPKSNPEATFSVDDNHEKRRVVDREEDEKRNKKKRNATDDANEQVAGINADHIRRLPDAAEEVPDENRKMKKRKRMVADDDEEEPKTGTSINLRNENNKFSINGGIIVHDVDSENQKKKKKKIKNIEGDSMEEGQRDWTSSNDDKIERVEGSAKRKKKKEKLYEANVVQEDRVMKNKSKRILIHGDQEGEGDELEDGIDIKKKKKKRRKVDVGE